MKSQFAGILLGRNNSSGCILCKEFLHAVACAACQNYCGYLLPSYSKKINMAQTSWRYFYFLWPKLSCAPEGRSEEEAFLWVSHLHLKCDATYMHSNAQEDDRSREGNLQHLVDEILQGTKKWKLLKWQACFCRSSTEAITQKHPREKKILPNATR